MQQGIGLEVPLRVIGPNGTVLWQGSGWLGVVYVGKASATITTNSCLQLTAASFIIQADNLAATSNIGANVLSVNLAPTTPPLLVGVSLKAGIVNEAIAIAGNGSIVPILTSAVTHTVGHHGIAAASGALGASSATAPASPALSIGFAVKNRGTTAQPSATDTGTDTRAGYLVSVHGT